MSGASLSADGKVTLTPFILPHGKFAGVGGLTGGDAVKSLPHVIKLGARFITSASEWNLMLAAGTERVKALRSLSLG